VCCKSFHQVPVVDDDDFNQDDSDDDEFKVLGIRKKDTSLQDNPQVTMPTLVGGSSVQQLWVRS